MAVGSMVMSETHGILMEDTYKSSDENLVQWRRRLASVTVDIERLTVEVFGHLYSKKVMYYHPSVSTWS
jgi:hypothetical protein